jgi:hypothetical protein
LSERLGIRDDSIADMNAATGDNPCPEATLPDEKLENLAMGTLSKETARLTQF